MSKSISSLRRGSRLTRNREFEFDFWNFRPLKRIEINGRRHYLCPNEEAYPSVTTVLGERTDKSGLIAWQESVGHEKAERIRVQAGNRGTAIHSIAEAYLLNHENYPDGTMPVNKMTFEPLKKILDERVGMIHAVEAPLYSSRLRTAGQTDCIAEFDGVPSIIDFKTSRRIKREEDIESYFLQATCYGEMTEELTGREIPQVVIILAPDHELPQVFVKRRADYLDRMLAVFDGT